MDMFGAVRIKLLKTEDGFSNKVSGLKRFSIRKLLNSILTILDYNAESLFLSFEIIISLFFRSVQRQPIMRFYKFHVTLSRARAQKGIMPSYVSRVECV